MADYSGLSDAQLSERMTDIRAQVERLAAIEQPTAGQSERFDNLASAIDAIEAEQNERARRREQYQQRRQVALDSVRAGRYESGFGGVEVMTRQGDPHEGLDGLSFRTMGDAAVRDRAMTSIERAPSDLPDSSRSLLEALVNRPRTGRDAGEFVLAWSNPAYRSAFMKVLRDPLHGHRLWDERELAAYQAVQSSRAAMSLTSANGGYLVPQLLDPTVILTNDGSSNPFRAISRVETGISDTFDTVPSDGVTAEWLPEGTEAADATPTFGSVQVQAHKGAAYVFGSYEVLGDTNIGEQVPRLLMDAKDRLEAEAFVSGSGSDAPYGVVTRVAAVTASRVDPTTGGAFSTASVADVYAVDEGLTDRARQSRQSAWVANRKIFNIIRQMDSAGGSSFWANLGESMPEQLLGRPNFEASSMDATVTTGSNVLLAGDFSQFLIYDRLGMSVVYDPVVLGSNRRPTAQGAWLGYWRTGADVTDSGAFRVLQL